MLWMLLRKSCKRVWEVIPSGYFFIVLMNGVLEMLWNYFGENGGYLFFLLCSCGVVIVGVRIWKNYAKMQKGIFYVELLHRGKGLQISGLYDSGNRLKDPYSGKGVHIISKRSLVQLGIMLEGKEMSNSGGVYIPYKALGNEEDILEVYYVEKISVWGEKGQIIMQNCPVGVTKDNLFEGKKYEMIMNEEVF